MQATIRARRFVLNHTRVALVLATTLLVITAGTAALKLTKHDSTAGSGAHAAVVQVSAQPRQLPHPSDRSAALRSASPPPSASLDRADQLAQFAKSRQARLEADQLHEANVAARAAQLKILQQFYKHKEEQLDAMPRIPRHV